jgi:hypothetical protein
LIILVKIIFFIPHQFCLSQNWWGRKKLTFKFLNMENKFVQIPKSIRESGCEVVLTPGSDITIGNPITGIPDIPEVVEGQFPVITYVKREWKVLWFEDQEKAQEEKEKIKPKIESLLKTKDFFDKSKTSLLIDKISYPERVSPLSISEMFKLAGLGDVVLQEQVFANDFVPGRRLIEDQMYSREVSWKYDDREKIFFVSNKYKHPNEREEYYYKIALKAGANKEYFDQNILNIFDKRVDSLKNILVSQLEKMNLFSIDGRKVPFKYGESLFISGINREDGGFILKHELERLNLFISSSLESGALECVQRKKELEIESLACNLNKVIEKWNALSLDPFSLESLEESGEILVNFGGRVRSSGSNNETYWVIESNGASRPATIDDTYQGEGKTYWDIVFSDELALYHAKDSNASAHCFEVKKLPLNLTEEQINTVYKLEEEKEQKWKGRKGLASGIESPPIGKGWGITNSGDLIYEEQDEIEEVKDEGDYNTPSTSNDQMMEALRKAGLIK